MALLRAEAGLPRRPAPANIRSFLMGVPGQPQPLPLQTPASSSGAGLLRDRGSLGLGAGGGGVYLSSPP